MLILPQLTDELEIRGEMKRCNSFSPTSLFVPLLRALNGLEQWPCVGHKGRGSSRPCLGHRPPPFNLHFIMVTSAVGPKGLTPLLTTKAVSSNIWGYWHCKEPLSVVGIVSCGTSQWGEAAASQTMQWSFCRGDCWCSVTWCLVPWHWDPGSSHKAPLYLGTGGNGKQNTLWRLE